METIRFYERKGLIEPPPRKESGYRQYPEKTIARLFFIRRAKELGFSLKEIKELLYLRYEAEGRGKDCGTTRKIEVFSAGCPLCKDTVELMHRLPCPSCDVTVVDMQDITGATRALELGVKSVPAVAIDGKLADCCIGRGVDGATLRGAGLGQAMA